MHTPSTKAPLLLTKRVSLSPSLWTISGTDLLLHNLLHNKFVPGCKNANAVQHPHHGTLIHTEIFQQDVYENRTERDGR